MLVIEPLLTAPSSFSYCSLQKCLKVCRETTHGTVQCPIGLASSVTSSATCARNAPMARTRPSVPMPPCDRGGISFAGQCYLLVTEDTDITWTKAQTLCRNAGAYIVSPASPREWSDVMTWLHLAVPWLERRMYIITYLGLAAPPSTLPSM